MTKTETKSWEQADGAVRSKRWRELFVLVSIDMADLGVIITEDPRQDPDVKYRIVTQALGGMAQFVTSGSRDQLAEGAAKVASAKRQASLVKNEVAEADFQVEKAGRKARERALKILDGVS